MHLGVGSHAAAPALAVLHAKAPLRAPSTPSLRALASTFDSEKQVIHDRHRRSAVAAALPPSAAAQASAAIDRVLLPATPHDSLLKSGAGVAWEFLEKVRCVPM
jgi:hypothetical protein